MLSHSYRSEISWFVLGFLGALLAGILVGWPATCTLVFLCGYGAWLLHRMSEMVRWLRTGAKPSEAPPTAGMTNEMVQLIHREKKYSRKQRERYRSTLMQFKSLAADLPDATVVLNQDHEIRWSNSAALTLLNIHPEKDRGQRIDNLIRLPEFREFLHSADSEDELEISNPTAIGKTLAIRKVPTGRHMKVLIAADITQRVHVREMRKAFVGDVSHELRTPLTVIRGYLEILRENDSLDPEVSSCLTHISAQSDRMRGIVEDLLQLSKLEGNPLAENEGETVNISTMVQSMVNALGEVAPNHEFKLSLDPSLAVLGSESELYSACNNLLTNAVRYTGKGTVITISWHAMPDGSAKYCVSDNGPGIGARHLSRLSERFYRVDTSRSRDAGGTGLGLAIVKHAAQRHGGVLNVRSTLGKGSEFEIILPASRIISLQSVVNQ